MTKTSIKPFVHMVELDKEDPKLVMQYPVLRDTVFAVQYVNGRMAGVVPFIFTWAIISDFDCAGYNDRWCYGSLADALGALKDWNGEGEPSGWHRHPTTGRRMGKDGEELGVW